MITGGASKPGPKMQGWLPKMSARGSDRGTTAGKARASESNGAPQWAEHVRRIKKAGARPNASESFDECARCGCRVGRGSSCLTAHLVLRVVVLAVVDLGAAEQPGVGRVVRVVELHPQAADVAVAFDVDELDVVARDEPPHLAAGEV